ncbi:MAG TPA: hypothetical protein VGH29_08190, partial [Candidatus Binataceae bacterium]
YYSLELKHETASRGFHYRPLARAPSAAATEFTFENARSWRVLTPKRKQNCKQLSEAWQLGITTVPCTLSRASRLLRKETQQPRRLPSPATKRARGLKAAAPDRKQIYFRFGVNKPKLLYH